MKVLCLNYSKYCTLKKIVAESCGLVNASPMCFIYKMFIFKLISKRQVRLICKLLIYSRYSTQVSIFI